MPTHMERLLCAQHLGVDLADPSEPRSDSAGRRHQNRSQGGEKKKKKRLSASFLLCVYLSSLVSMHNFLQFRERMNLKEATGEEEIH